MFSGYIHHLYPYSIHDANSRRPEKRVNGSCTLLFLHHKFESIEQRYAGRQSKHDHLNLLRFTRITAFNLLPNIYFSMTLKVLNIEGIKENRKGGAVV